MTVNHRSCLGHEYFTSNATAFMLWTDAVEMVKIVAIDHHSALRQKT